MHAWPHALAVTHAQVLAASLHVQVVAVQNFHALLPIVLNQLSMQCTQWHGLFLNTLGKYTLADHANLDDAPEDAGDWEAMECNVRSWMYASIAPDLLTDIMTSGASTCRIWLTIEDQFIGNKETHTLIINAEFHNFV
jgi:hypothetical protein